jgi:non-lysosomal glucosylceramidase
MASAAVFALLNASFFFSSGRVTSSDSYINQAVDCLYLEPENVTLATDTWAVSSRLNVPQQGPCIYLYQLNGSAPAPPACNASSQTPGLDRPGYDYQSTPSYPSPSTCEAACCGNTACAAWVWVPNAPGPYMGCKDTNQPCCYLKSASPAPTNSTIPGIVSGERPTGPPAPVVAPPVGMRSSVPLGGIGAGSFELRADGTVHEFTAHEASPAGSAKLGVVGDLMLGVRVAPANQQGAPGVARAVRTGYLGSAYGAAQTVDAITYSGSYPLSRLAIEDAGLASTGLVASPAVYAYSRFAPGDLNRSSAPAVSFTFTATNPSATDSADVSLFLSLPWGAINDCFSDNGNTSLTTSAASAAACMHTCLAQPEEKCAAWQWDSSTLSCRLQAGVLSPIVQQSGWYCGTRGAWSVSADNTTLTMAQGAASACDPAAVANPSALCGEWAVRAVQYGDVAVSYGAGDSLADLWPQFAATGGFAQPLAPGAAATGAALGAAAATVTLAPGESRAVTLVFAWYFPNRDYMLKTLGTWYQNLYPSSSAVLDDVATPADQEATVADLNAHHQVFAGAGGMGSEPAWLVDTSINSFSHMRSAMHFADGRWRQWEAYDCDDIDSVHK